MHIPDGFIPPIIYIPAYVVDVGLLVHGFKKIKQNLNENTLPILSVLSALSFVLMSISFPVFGGTSVHITGVAILSITFGYWVSFFSTSLILFLQAVLFGEGGITSFPINSLAISFLGSLSAYLTFRILKNFLKEEVSCFLSGWVSINLSALVVALILGLVPVIAHDNSGNPLYFPFSWDITIPALMLPHFLVGIVEGLYTASVYKILKSKGFVDV